jgi:hypothetical protein
MVVSAGFEPRTVRFRALPPYRLDYETMMVGLARIEQATSGLQPLVLPLNYSSLVGTVRFALTTSCL